MMLCCLSLENSCTVMVLTLFCALGSPGVRIKYRFLDPYLECLVYYIWFRPQKTEFITSSQVVLIWLMLGPFFENIDSRIAPCINMVGTSRTKVETHAQWIWYVLPTDKEQEL
jgi:hypothetical protein